MNFLNAFLLCISMVSINGLFSSVQEIKKDTYINDVKHYAFPNNSVYSEIQ